MKIGKDTIEIVGLISSKDYQRNKDEIENSSRLQFYNQKDDFNLRLQNMNRDSSMAYLLLSLVVGGLIVLSVLSKDKTLDDGNYKILQIVFCILIGALAWFIAVFIRDKLISKWTKISIFIFPIPMLFFLYIFYKVLAQSEQNRTPGFIVMSIILYLVSLKFIKFLPLYMINDYTNKITIFLTIVTLIFGPDLTCDFGMLFLTYLLNIALIQIGLSSKLEDNQSEAEKIFESILIGDTEKTYKNLLLCYAKGGNKYKEKILSNKEFLEIVRGEEL
jgi:hypothetical protein